MPATFSRAWLSLREPADVASRNAEVLAACAKRFARHRTLTICDIGAGTGASVRAFAGMLPAKQSWLLMDHDARNLKAALEVLGEWSRVKRKLSDGVVLKRGAKEITVRTRQCDLTEDIEWPRDAGLVTASALLDLTSRKWISRLVKDLRKRKLPLLATLTFDGRIAAQLPHPSDGPIVESFHKHQTRDKGFGKAAGSRAAAALEKALTRAGYEIVTGNSPWILNRRKQKKLLTATLEGIAQAAREQGDISARDVAAWEDHAKRAVGALIIGHRDVFADI